MKKGIGEYMKDFTVDDEKKNSKKEAIGEDEKKDSKEETADSEVAAS